MDKFTIRDANGTVDTAASVRAYSNALAAWVSANETPVDSIERAVEAVFDTHDKRMPTGFLVDCTMQELNVDPERFQTVSKHVVSYVKGQVASGRIDSTKGTGGGLSRLARPGEPIPARQVKA